MKRRNLILGAAGVAGAGLLLGVMGRTEYFERSARQLVARPGEQLLATWLKIASDGTITVYVPHADMGQGAWTALAMMVADELDADWAKVRVEQAPAHNAFANTVFAEGFLLKGRMPPDILEGAARHAFGEIARLAHLQVTGGSASVRFTGQRAMRVAGAATREMLLLAAARKWDALISELSTRDSVVTHMPTGRKAGYGELAESAAMFGVPDVPRLKSRREWRLMGTPVPRVEIPDKVTGRTRYGIDVQLPGMLVATVMASPVHGGRLQSVDEAPAKAIAGVERVVQMPDSVALVGRGYWPAISGLRALKPVFDLGVGRGTSSADYSRDMALALAPGNGKSVHSAGKPDESGGGATVRANYEVPLLHHATMEPINVTAQWDNGRLRVWGSEQDALGARTNLIDISGLPDADVEFQPMAVGGGFGRKSAPKRDHLRQAVAIAKAMSPRPVKLIWSREEDFAQGTYRPAVATRIEASLGADGKPHAWRQSFIDTAGLINEGYPLPYAIPNQSLVAVNEPSHVRVGAWRSVAHSQHGFFTESFIDELAQAAGRDPFEYRRDLLEPGSRPRRVLETAAARAGWGQPLPAGHGRGIAYVESFGSMVAEVIEASFVPNDPRPRVHRVTAVVDCGILIHPDTGRQQVEGAIIMGLSAALGEAITIKDGAVQQRSFPDYPILKMAEVPEIDIVFIENNEAPGGLGEVGLPPVAPALANALAAASGKRIRKLPLGDAERGAAAA